jgi:predicted HTH domain antitoxin
MMRTAKIQFEITEDILNALNQNINEFTQKSRLYTALQLFKDHKLSFGKAAELAGISKDEFLIELDKNNIDFISYDPSDLEAELERFE